MPGSDEDIKKATQKVGEAAKAYGKSLTKLGEKRNDEIKAQIKIIESMGELGSGDPGLIAKGGAALATSQATFVKEVQERSAAELDASRSYAALQTALKELDKKS
jgi:hypothetical protein